ncbi:hypothetical protein PHJA_001853900 [Phtheirospermum japonicum]|uniref:Uncharacterized protein n=1 Tax=Phtheirospermum japonicum TaxID=374723 RepID=A0A830CIQ8_9LAMI|nr:hypothetical protein PHJA_001853900 [Phtheirospermum japonicum]
MEKMLLSMFLGKIGVGTTVKGTRAIGRPEVMAYTTPLSLISRVQQKPMIGIDSNQTISLYMIVLLHF